MLRALPEAVEEIRVHAEVMGRLRAGPSPSMAGSGVSHLFERNARIACGSSCVPSNENYTGTLGALLLDGRASLRLGEFFSVHGARSAGRFIYGLADRGILVLELLISP